MSLYKTPPSNFCLVRRVYIIWEKQILNTVPRMLDRPSFQTLKGNKCIPRHLSLRPFSSIAQKVNPNIVSAPAETILRTILGL